MSLPNNYLNPERSFFLFTTLPIELRRAMWQASLRSRVIRIVKVSAGEQGFEGNGHVNEEPDKECMEAIKRMATRRTRDNAIRTHLQSVTWGDDAFQATGDESQPQDHGKTLCHRFRTFYHTKFPAAFYVCRDSREAVLPFYPLCFASATHPPSTRFNLSLDILCIAQTDMSTTAELFRAFRPLEISGLSNLAVDENWTDLEEYKPARIGWINKLAGLQNVLVCRSMRAPLTYVMRGNYYFRKHHLLPGVDVQSTYDRAKDNAQAVLTEVFFAERSKCYNRIDLYDEFPDGILVGVDVGELSGFIPQIRLEPNLDWLSEKGRRVWAWPRRLETGCYDAGVYHSKTS